MRTSSTLLAVALAAMSAGCAFDTTESGPDTETAYIPPAEVEGSLGANGGPDNSVECQQFGVDSENAQLDAIEIRCAPWAAADPKDPTGEKQAVIDPTQPDMRSLDVSSVNPY
jgi:hypothetical protein